MYLLKGLLLITLAIISIQDFKDRLVWIFLFPLFGIIGSYLFLKQSIWEIFSLNILINLAFVGMILLLNYLVATYALKKKFLKEAFGLGDILFIIAFSISFPTISFINFFVFSLLFTIVMHFLFKKIKSPHYKTVPLAGAMSLFLMAVYLSHWFGWFRNIYLV